ncbi:MAG: pilus assembly protein [Eubacterium sp.]|nr:pilus assembly protein [Eubacterium sp.]
MSRISPIKSGGYYTVEATFIMTVCIVVLMAIMYTGLYVHDRMIIETVSQRVTSRWIHMTDRKKWDENTFKEKLISELDQKLFVLPVHGVSVSGTITKKITVRYSVPISIGFLKRIWGGQTGEREETVSVPDIWPAKWKWDADEVRDGLGNRTGLVR